MKSSNPLCVEITEHSRNVHSIHLPIGNKEELKVLLTSDVHFDSMKCDRTMLKRHFDQAVDQNAVIIIAGDWFDAMQGKWDPRGNKDELRPEYRTGAYFDSVIDDTVEFLMKYPVALLALGNHETSVQKRHEINMSDRVVSLMRSRGHSIHLGGYGGWVKFRGAVRRYSSESGGGSSAVLKLKYFHGSGGGGMMTHGVLSTRRQASFLPDADIILNGHTHDSWMVTLARERLVNNTVKLDNQVFIRTPGYKNDYGDGSQGWAIERGMPPKPLGSAWLKLKMRATNETKWIEYDITSAK
jgi:predicted phosphodiesterase